MDPDYMFRAHSVCSVMKSSLEVHLKISSRRDKLTTFSQQKINWQVNPFPGKQILLQTVRTQMKCHIR